MKLNDKHIIYSPTMNCNCNCLHCFIKDKHSENELTLEEIEKIFPQFKGSKIELTGGEVFLKQDIVGIIRFLLSQDIELGIATNGTLPGVISQVLDIAKPNQIYFSISIDGIDQVHDSIRGKKNAFNFAEITMDMLRIKNFKFQIVTVIQNDNLESLSDIKKHFDGKCDKHIFLPLMGYGPRTFDYKYERAAKEFMNGFQTDSFYLETGALMKDCTAGDNGFYIAPDGMVSACYTRKEIAGSDAYDFYNLRDTWLNNILDSRKAWLIRQLIEKCPGCYNGCELTRENEFNNEIKEAT